MAEINVTVADSFIPSIWAKDVIKARLAKLVVFSRVMNRTAEITKGDTLYVPLISELSTSDLGEDGSYTPQAITETKATLTINQRKVCPIQITDETEVKSAYDLRKEYAPMIGDALGKAIDTYILGLMYAGATTTQTAKADVDESSFLSALGTLDDYNVPESQRYCALCPNQYNKLLGDATYKRADLLGTSKSAVLSGILPGLYGLEILKTTQVPNSTYRYNMVWHKSAVAAGLSKQVKLRVKEVSGRTATDVLGWEYYGAGVERATHIVNLPTTNGV